MTHDYKALEKNLREIFHNDDINVDCAFKKDGSVDITQVSWKDGPTADLMNWHLGKFNIPTDYLERELSEKAGDRIVEQLLSEGYIEDQFYLNTNDGYLISIMPESDAPEELEDRIDYLIENYQDVPESAIPKFDRSSSPEM